MNIEHLIIAILFIVLLRVLYKYIKLKLNINSIQKKHFDKHNRITLKSVLQWF